MPAPATLTDEGPLGVEDAIQKRPDVYPGIAVPSVEKIKVANAVGAINTGSTTQARRAILAA
jgi:hypothetical protein